MPQRGVAPSAPALYEAGGLFSSPPTLRRLVRVFREDLATHHQHQSYGPREAHMEGQMPDLPVQTPQTQGYYVPHISHLHIDVLHARHVDTAFTSLCFLLSDV